MLLTGMANGIPVAEVVSIVPAPTHATELVLRTAGAPERNPAIVYLARLRSPTSRATMESALKVIAAMLAPVPDGDTPTPYHTIAWHRLQYAHGALIKTRLAAKHTTRTVNKMLCALRGVIEESINLGLITDGEGAWRSRLHGYKVDNDDEPAGRALDDSEVQRLVSACNVTTTSGMRDAAMLALLFGAALRRREAAGIQLADFDDRRGRVRVLGKGAKHRTVQLATDSAEIVRAWVAVRGRSPGPLLVSFTPQRRIKMADDGTPTGLTESGVYIVLAAIAERAEVAGITPHDARRTRITEMLMQGESLAFVRRVAGHKSSKTTDRYDRSADEAAHEASARVPMLKPKPAAE